VKLTHRFADELTMIFYLKQLTKTVYIVVEHVHAISILVEQRNTIIFSETHYLAHNTL